MRFILPFAPVVAVALAQPTPRPRMWTPPQRAPSVGVPGQAPQGAFVMGRLKYGKNQGNDCGDVGMDLIKLLSRVSTLDVKEERLMFPTDPQLFETPFVFMNGHHDFVLADADIRDLKTYFTRGGFLLASECCTQPAFPRAWRREFARVFPNRPIKRLPYDHPIYRSFYRITRIPCLHESRDVYLEGLFHRGRLVAVLCGDGLCCAFAMDNTCNRGRGISPDDGKKLALNVAVYALTH